VDSGGGFEGERRGLVGGREDCGRGGVSLTVVTLPLTTLPLTTLPLPPSSISKSLFPNFVLFTNAPNPFLSSSQATRIPLEDCESWEVTLPWTYTATSFPIEEGEEGK